MSEIMKAEEKAKELVNKFMEVPNYARGFEPKIDKKIRCIQYALICVDEIIKTAPKAWKRKKYPMATTVTDYYEPIDDTDYWKKVKQEIKTLEL